MVKRISAAMFFLVFLSLLLSGVHGSPGKSGDWRNWLVLFRDLESKAPFASREQLIRGMQDALDLNIRKIRGNIRMEESSPVRLWIVNGVGVHATPDEASRFEGLPNVLEVIPVTEAGFLEESPCRRVSVSRESGAPVWGVARIMAPETWRDLGIDGSGVLVGQMDTGVDASHPALAGKVVAFRDFTKNPKPDPYDDNGHGTHTCGTIVGGEGVGVAPGARLIVAKAFDRIGNGTDLSTLQAMQWLLDPDGNPATNDAPRVISNSWSRKNLPDPKLYWKAIEAWVAAGIVPVFSSGNSGAGSKVGIPGSYPHSWTVGATAESDTLANFSTTGPSSWDGITYVKPDISAPGSGIVSCAVGGGYASEDGTSMAVPHVSGLVALMLQADPRMTVGRIRSLAESASRDLGATGKDNEFGAGRCDAFSAVEAAMKGVPFEVSLAAYDEALAREGALAGRENFAPMSSPLAGSILRRAVSLSVPEFAYTVERVSRTGSAAVRKLLEEAASLRKGAEAVESFSFR